MRLTDANHTVAGAVYASEGSTPTTHGAADFADWWADHPGRVMPFQLALAKDAATGVYSLPANSSILPWPIDGAVVIGLGISMRCVRQ